jgi:hypothetical protein
MRFCCDERRRALVRQHAALNGIDFLEVVDHDEPAAAERQRRLRVSFVKPPAPPLKAALLALTPAGVRITGGVRTLGIVADAVQLNGDVLEVHVTPRGDFSPYTLSLVGPGGAPPAGLDPRLASVTFSFKVECEGDFDCRASRVCPPETPPEPEIDYLARDYASFRRLMLDRLAVLLPDWQEGNPADVGVALVELLAYVGDHLSYRQDAVATEAYLGTARRRASVRRHARLLDYFLHEGCNARAWVQVQVTGDGLTLPQGTQLLTRVADAPAPLIRQEKDYLAALAAGAEVFETMHAVRLFAAHNRIAFYTFGDRSCCLPRGSTAASLVDPTAKPETRLRLLEGDVLILEEQKGPQSGRAEDADSARRHAVRLTSVRPRAKPAPGGDRTPAPPVTDPVTGVAYVEVEWAAEDALPFALCLSGVTDAEHGGQYLDDVSVARGNVVLADHGRTVSQALDPVPADVFLPGPPPDDRCEDREPVTVRPRFEPLLAAQPLTQAATVNKTEVTPDGSRRQLAFDPTASAAAVLSWDMDQVFPAITLADPAGPRWLPRLDLLSSDAFAADFVAEPGEGAATLRFGDDRNGRRPPAGTRLTAEYRVGNGTRGNVGAEAIRTVADVGARLLNADLIAAARNPLPAQGGVEPETLEHARQSAPSAFRVPQRAVTPEDYALVAGLHPQVQRAAATVRWTGSWRTVFLTVDRLGGLPVDADFQTELRDYLETYRMAGQDVEIDGPLFVPLEVEVQVCVDPDYFRGDVVAALSAVLGSVALPDGRRGLFYPDNFTFGQPVYLSRLYVAALAVAGVRSALVTTFRRLGEDDDGRALAAGVLTPGRMEIARLDNDPNFPDRGVLRLFAKGGR